MFNKVTIIGVGLIGGSIARALKKNHLCTEITGYARNKSELEKAVQLSVIDNYQTEIDKAVKGSDLVIIATPVGVFDKIFQNIKSSLDPNTLITDAGSSKVSVIEAAKQVFGDLPETFVPGHPIAGNEKSGVEASIDNLFENRCTILTPLEQTNRVAVEKITAMWQAMGASVVCMSAEHHDQVLAATSHLPHLLAFTLVDALAQMQEHSEIFRFAAGGFRDFTRIASSDPLMWKDICLNNRDAILKMIAVYKTHLQQLENAISTGNAAQVETIFRRAKKARDEHVIQ